MSTWKDWMQQVFTDLFNSQTEPMVEVGRIKRGDEIEPGATIQPDGLPKMIGRTCNGLALWSYHDDCNPV